MAAPRQQGDGLLQPGPLDHHRGSCGVYRRLGVWSVDGSPPRKATELLGRAVRIAEADLLRDGEKEDPEADPPRYKTSKERSDAVFKAVDELSSQYGSSDASKRGVLLKAGQLYDQGKVC